MASGSARPAFTSGAAAAAFFAAYDAVLTQWPVPVTAMDVPTAYGRTHVNACGSLQAPAIVLLHGAAATSTVWFANVAALSARYRVYAIDQMGDAGRSTPHGHTLTTPSDVARWLTEVLDGLGLATAALVGHSYGAWLALNLARAAPDRVSKLVLLDPTNCFAGLAMGYRYNALGLFARPSANAVRRFLSWETGATSLDPAWLELAARAGGEFRRSKPVRGPAPRKQRWVGLTMPILVLLAGNSRAHSIRRVAAAVHRRLPEAVTRVLPDTTHHTLPIKNPDRLNAEILHFLQRD